MTNETTTWDPPPEYRQRRTLRFKIGGNPYVYEMNANVARNTLADYRDAVGS
jgi:hypothetical protein